MPIPVKFRKSAEPIIANFSYSEISTGRAVKLLYLVDFTTTGTTQDYQLTEGVTYATTGATRKGPTESYDIDFDLDILKPISLDGTGSFTFPVSYYFHSGSPASLSMTFTATLRKYDGTTETDIATGNVTITSGTISAGATVFRRTIYLDISKTKLKAGETLRLTFSGTVPSGSIGTVLGHDPKNRSTITGTGNATADTTDWSTNGSEAFMYLPVRI